MLSRNINHYSLSKDGRYWIFTNHEDKDVFYFSPTERPCFPDTVSFDYEKLEDQYLSYIQSKLANNEDEAFCIKYLRLFFERLLSYDLFHLVELNQYFANKQGKLELRNIYSFIKTVAYILDYPLNFLYLNKPYSTSYRSLLFYMNIHEIIPTKTKDYQQITQTEFESNLCNEELKAAYIDIYSNQNSFFLCAEEIDVSGFNYLEYYTVMEGKLPKMFFVKTIENRVPLKAE